MQEKKIGKNTSLAALRQQEAARRAEQGLPPLLPQDPQGPQESGKDAAPSR